MFPLWVQIFIISLYYLLSSLYSHYLQRNKGYFFLIDGNKFEIFAHFKGNVNNNPGRFDVNSLTDLRVLCWGFGIFTGCFCMVYDDVHLSLRGSWFELLYNDKARVRYVQAQHRGRVISESCPICGGWWISPLLCSLSSVGRRQGW